jgi:hypothetical protein
MRSDSQLFVNSTKVTPTASGTFVAFAARLWRISNAPLTT